jgi:DNA-directed RNA polymerase subunit RPC12/RpoP
MSFWNSRTRIARIPHRCEYCGKQIEVGEQYSRETGVYDGEFNDYSMCSRCKGAWTYLSGESCGELGNLFDDVMETDILHCPICGGFNLREYDFADDMLSVECQCDKCDHKYMVDLSEEAIKKHFNEIGGETS